MDSKLIMENYLLILKSTMEVYVHGTLESSNNEVRTNLKKCLNTTLECQANTYDEMTKCGWYTICNVDSNTIKKCYDKLCNN